MMDDPDYNRLWQALGHDPTGMDRLVERTGFTTAALSSMLLVMELDGRIAVEHGRYARTRLDTPNTPPPGARRVTDRQSVVSGKCVSCRVDIGGRRFLQTNN